MNFNHDRLRRRGLVWAWGLLLTLSAACGGSNSVGPTETPVATAPTGEALPADSAALVDSTLLGIPTDSAAAITPSALAAGTQPGIVFGSANMDPQYLTSVHTGTFKGGGITPLNVLSFLAAARAKNARVVLKLCMGSDSYVKNPDGTFSLTKWKALVARFQTVNLGPYIADGTLIGHYLIDEPSMTTRWGGKIISHTTLEAMAQYSKQLWPEMTTFVRAAPSWLAQTTITYKYVDAGWLQYASNKGDVTKLVAAEVAAGKRKGLGLMVGLNALDGGNGSSRIRGPTAGKYSMSASELRSYGAALLNQPYACGFYVYSYAFTGPTYYARTDIKAAMAELSSKARSHVRTSCRQ